MIVNPILKTRWPGLLAEKELLVRREDACHAISDTIYMEYLGAEKILQPMGKLRLAYR